MIELGQLESRHEDFERRNIRVIAISMEETAEAVQTQERFPHLNFIADSSRGMSGPLQLIHAKARPDGGDADVPTTVIVDRNGMVRWLYRSSLVISRLSPDEVLKAADESLK